VARQEGRDAIDRGLQVILALPLAQSLDIGRQFDDLLADRCRMRRVVSGHDEERDVALAHEFAADAGDEVAASTAIEPIHTAGADLYYGLYRQKAISERSPPGAKIISGKALPCTS
jgi:hypothetical protein